MSNIKIQDVDQRIQYTATAGQTEFAIPFPFFENSDIVSYKDDTLLILTTDYTLSGASSPSGGTLTLVVAATAGDIITIQGDMPIDRTSIYSATISNLTGSDLNQDFNREVVIMKQIETTQNILQLQYTPYLEVSQDVSVTRDRWLPILGASQVWAMNSAGTAIEALDFDNTADAPVDAHYFLAQPDGQLPNGVDFGSLTTGLLKHTVSAGVSTPASAIAATDYWAPGNDLTTPNSPVSGTDVTNKTYVDAVATGAIWLHAARVATTSNFSSTYDNGTAGVGATLTASSNGAASIDGISLSLNDRVLFKDQTSALENGIYIVTQVGDASNPAIFTRSTDFDEAAEIEPGDMVPVRDGSTNENSFWVQTADVNTIGTDDIDFSSFGVNAGELGLASVQVFTANGTWTKPAGIARVVTEIAAGGGGGGGVAGAGGTVAAAGGGGGGGGYARKLIDVSAIASETVTVGLGGAGGLGSTPAPGDSGGTTSFGAHCSATGGGGGRQRTATTVVTFSHPGTGGAGSSGDLNVDGIPGHAGMASPPSAQRQPGCGGSTMLGNGATADESGTITPPLNGGGGRGGATVSSSNSDGGDGADGIVIVWEFK